MNVPLTIECPVHFCGRTSGSRQNVPSTVAQPSPAAPTARVPRIARLMALALRCQQLVQTGVIANYALLAQLGHVSRARVTQILNLCLLAPAIQEALLFLPRTEHGRDPIRLRHLQPLTRIADWREQRKRWQTLLSNREPAPSR